MKLLRLNMETGKIEFESLREGWLPIAAARCWPASGRQMILELLEGRYD